MALLKRKKNADQTQAAPQQDANGAVMEEIDAEEVMRKYDKESNTRIWEGVPKIIVTTFMVAFSVYCLLMTLLSTEQAEARLARFLAFVVVIGFMMYPARKTNHKVNHIPWYDIVLAALGFGSFMFFATNCTDILLMGARIEPLHVVLGVVGILVLVELCRRCVGLPIIIVVLCLAGYAFYWQITSSSSADPFAALRKIVQKLFYTTSGVIGTPVNVCYTYIVLFIIFGAFLERTGISNFFISLANRIAGWSSGGAAKVSVIASALCGMVSGSSVGNTVTTGSVTIPMMKKTGYKPEFAGAVEAAVVLRRPDHAAHHGRGSVPHGRIHGHPLPGSGHEGPHPRASVLRRHLHRRAPGSQEAGPEGRAEKRASRLEATWPRTATSSCRWCCWCGWWPRAPAPWPSAPPSPSSAPSSSASSTS